jgi:hypothetical protein
MSILVSYENSRDIVKFRLITNWSARNGSLSMTALGYQIKEATN